MKKSRTRMKKRIELRRQQGQPPTAIAHFVHRTCGTGWSRKLAWTPSELMELERLDREFRERKAEKARKIAEAARAAAREAAARWVPLPPRPPNLKREGMSPWAVRQLLECSIGELNRWVEDGRLTPDGERFYYGVGPRGGSKWGRAWFRTSILDALSCMDEWRAQDDAADRRRRTSETLLYELIRARFPDAVPQWSPSWLGRQTVDIYVPSINVAFEYQGEQHYKPLPIFGGEDGLRATQARDARKRERLARNRIALIEWRFDTPIVDVELNRALLEVSTSLLRATLE